jgi:hypothetical protein
VPFGKLFQAQTYPRDRQPQVVRHAGQCLCACLHQRVQRALHAVEGMRCAGDFARPRDGKGRLFEVARQPVGGAREHGQRPGQPAHHEHGQQTHRDGHQQQAADDAQRALGGGGRWRVAEGDDAAVVQARLCRHVCRLR